MWDRDNAHFDLFSFIKGDRGRSALSGKDVFPLTLSQGKGTRFLQQVMVGMRLPPSKMLYFPPLKGPAGLWVKPKPASILPAANSEKAEIFDDFILIGFCGC